MKRFAFSIIFLFLTLNALTVPGFSGMKKTSSDADFKNPEGFLNLMKGHYNEAISIFSKEIIKNPLDANSYFYRGLAYHRKSQNDRAVSDYTKAIEIDPNYAEAFFCRGTIYQNMGQDTKAVNDYTSSIKIDSRYVKAYKNRSLVYFSRKEYDKALEDLKKAEELGLNLESQITNKTKKTPYE